MSAQPLVSIVDDDASSRAALLGLVRALGFRAAAFASAAAFLTSDEARRTACLLADQRMPGMTGLDLHLFLLDAGRRIPTILVTAFPDEPTRRRAQQAGIACYLAKPLAPEALLAAVRDALDGTPTGG